MLYYHACLSIGYVGFIIYSGVLEQYVLLSCMFECRLCMMCCIWCAGSVYILSYMFEFMLCMMCHVWCVCGQCFIIVCTFELYDVVFVTYRDGMLCSLYC